MLDSSISCIAVLIPGVDEVKRRSFLTLLSGAIAGRALYDGRLDAAHALIRSARAAQPSGDDHDVRGHRKSTV
jgi:hypothetical protein